MDELLHDRKGGLLVVTLPEQGALGFTHTDRAHYFARTVKAGKVRDALLHWFSLWGIGLTHSPTKPNALERSTFEVVWCDAMPEKLHGPQTVPFYADGADRVLEAIALYEPKVILVLSAYLYEALASAGVAPRVTHLIGRAKGQARRITQARLKALHQSFERSEVLVLPTPSKNTTDAYVLTLSGSVREVFERAGFNLSEGEEALIHPAQELLVLDENSTLTRWMNHFRIDQERAMKLMDTLEEKGIVTAKDDKGRRFVKVQ